MLSLKPKHVEINLKVLQPRFLNIRGPRTSEEVWSLTGAKRLEVGGGSQSTGRDLSGPQKTECMPPDSGEDRSSGFSYPRAASLLG